MERLKELSVKIDESLGLEGRVMRLETQMARIVSDIESEKETRTRTNERFDDRMKELERTIWKAGGAVTAAVAILEIGTKLIH